MSVPAQQMQPITERTIAPVTPGELLRIAMERGAGLEQLEKFMALKERWDATEAVKAFNAAFSDFKAEAVKIIKGTQIKDGPLKGRFHANLFDVVNGTTPHLSRHGLTIAWKLTKDDPTWMEVTCTLRHVGGHFESVSMGGAPDTGPGRNAIQARGSTKTYLERYTATAILGLAAQDADNDGGGAGPQPITTEQACLIDDLIKEVGADKAKFLRYFKAKSVDEIHAQAFKDAVAALEAKRKATK